MFKSLDFFRIDSNWHLSAGRLEKELQTQAFVPCGATQTKSWGWLPPRGKKHGALLEAVNRQWLLHFCMEKKTVPAQTLKQKVQEEAARIEAEQGRKPGRKELRDLKDDLMMQLLPHAFARQSVCRIWISPEEHLLGVDSGNKSCADSALSWLMQAASDAGAPLHAAPVVTRITPKDAMTSWLLDDGYLSDEFRLTGECELKGGDERASLARFARHPLETPEVRQLVQKGELPVRIGLDWKGRVNFTLTDALQIKKLKFNVAVEQTEKDGDDDFDATVALETGDLLQVIDDLLMEMDGEEVSDDEMD